LWLVDFAGDEGPFIMVALEEAGHLSKISWGFDLDHFLVWLGNSSLGGNVLSTE